MNTETPYQVRIFGLILALIALFVALFSLNHVVRSAEAAGEMRVAVGCNPLTSSQAQPGTSQLCRIRIQNRSSAPITDITVSRPTPNTITDRYSYGWKQLDCNLTGCEPFTLQPGETAYIFEESTFNPYQDGRGKTTVTATGLQGLIEITASALERTNLP